MASLAIFKALGLKSHLAVASAAVFAVPYVIHGELIGAFLFLEYRRVAIRATQYLRVGFVRKQDIGHEPVVYYEDHVHVKHAFGLVPFAAGLDAAARFYESGGERRRPVRIPELVLWKPSYGLRQLIGFPDNRRHPRIERHWSGGRLHPLLYFGGYFLFSLRLILFYPLRFSLGATCGKGVTALLVKGY